MTSIVYAIKEMSIDLNYATVGLYTDGNIHILIGETKEAFIPDGVKVKPLDVVEIEMAEEGKQESVQAMIRIVKKIGELEKHKVKDHPIDRFW